MSYRYLILTLLISFFLSFNSFAQDAENGENPLQKKKIKLLEQILIESSKLRLPENRAVVYSEVANNIWESDEKRARKLFSKAVDELITAQTELQKLKDPEKYNELYYGNTPRRSIFSLIAKCDAEFALEQLLKSRPTIISETLQKYSLKSAKEYVKQSPYLESNIEREIQDEQRLYLLAIEQNPEKSVEFFRESLKKGVSRETLTFLYELNRKKPEISNRLTEEFAANLLDLELSRTNSKNYTIVLYFFQAVENSDIVNSNRLNISDKSYRALADKISAFWVKEKWASSINSREFYKIEKLFPERTNKIRSIYAEIMSQISNQNISDENKKFNELKLRDFTPEEILKEAEKFSSYRDSLYSLAIEKFLKRGDVETAVNLIKEINNKNQADYKISSIYSNLALETFRKGDLNTALQLIEKTPLFTSQIETLVTISKEVYQQNPQENKNLSETLLTKGLSYLENENETSYKKSWFLKLAEGFSEPNPKRAFSMTDSIIPEINQYNRALVVTSKFKDSSNRFIDEFSLPNSSNSQGFGYLTGGIYFDGVLSKLAIKDFEKTISLINKFERPEIRLSLKLNLIEFLNRISRKAN
jgi:hypothetical protein